VKIASRGFSKGTAKIPSQKLSTAAKKPEAPMLLERPADETTRQEQVAALKAQAKLKPASDL